MQMLPYNHRKVDIHYFDSLHKLLLQYIHEGKYEELLLVLSLPHICENALFWQTCTYQAGIIAVLLTAIIKKNRDNAHVSCNLNDSSESNKLGVNIHDVYHLLQHCVCVQQNNDYYSNNVLCATHEPKELELETNTLGKDVLLESLLSEIENGTAEAHIDLPVIYAVLREQCYRLEYTNPFSDSAKKKNARAIVPLKTYSHEMENVEHRANRSNDNNNNDENELRSVNVETAQQIILATSRLVHGTDQADKEQTESIASTNDTSNADHNLDTNTNTNDAVTLLQHIAPLSNTTHISSSFDEVANDDANNNNGINVNTTTHLEKTHLERDNNISVKNKKLSKGESAMIDANAPQQESKDKMAEIINAFDVFNAGEEEEDDTNTKNAQQSSEHVSHTSSSSSLSSIATPTSGANATHHTLFAKASNNTNKDYTNRHMSNSEHDRLYKENNNNINTNNMYTNNITGNIGRNYKRRRTHYTDAENTAIIHGVARYGQMPRNFPIIYESYKEVWLPGRTPMKLYDHWRDSLRRSAINDDSNFHGDE